MKLELWPQGSPIPLGFIHIFLHDKRHLSRKFKIVSQPEPEPTKMTKSRYDNSTLTILDFGNLQIVI